MFNILMIGEGTASERRPLDDWSPERAWRDCIPLTDLDLSEDQSSLIREKERLFRKQLMEIRVGVTAKRLEFIRIFRDPDSPEEAIRGKSRELEDALIHFQDLILTHALEIRQILHPKQRRQWCPPFLNNFQRDQGRRP